MVSAHVVRVLLVVGVLPAGCGEEELADLFVDVRTDVRPGYEFETVRVELVGAGSAGSGLVEQPATPDQEVGYLAGLRVAAFEDVDRSQARVRVALLDARGVAVLDRAAAVRLGSSDRVVTVVLTRDCAGVRCPAAGDEPSLVACLGGRCVDPRCTPETPETCPVGCTEDTQCAVEASCAAGRCDNGTCFRVEATGACGDTEWCHPETGCVARLDEVDATVPMDGGTDADVPMDGGTDATVPMDGGTDASGCVVDCGVLVPDGLVFHLPMDDDPSSGSTADVSGNGHTVTCTNCPSLVTGRVGGAHEFDGSNDYLRLAYRAELDLETYTVAFWVKLNRLDWYFSFVNRPFGTLYGLLVHSDITNELEFSLGDETGSYTLPTGYYFESGVWVHVAVARTPDNRYVWIDGSPLAPDVPQPQSYDGQDMFFGASVNGTGTHNYLDGALDDVRMYSRLLSDAEVAMLAEP